MVSELMSGLHIKFQNIEELDASLPGRFFDFKKLVQQFSTSPDTHESILEEFEQSISNQISITSWQPSIRSHLLQMVSTLALQEVLSLLQNPVPASEQVALRIMQRSDWLCSFSAIPGHHDIPERLEAAKLWMMSRLVVELPSTPATLLDEAARILAPLGIPESDLLDHIKLGLVLSLTALRTAGKNIDDHVDQIRSWCLDLLSCKSFSDVISDAARRLNITLPPVTVSTLAADATTPAEGSLLPGPVDASDTMCGPTMAHTPVAETADYQPHNEGLGRRGGLSWKRPQTESEISETFLRHLNELRRLAQAIAPDLLSEVTPSLDYAAKEYAAWKTGKRHSTSVFLLPAVYAATRVAAPLREAQPADGFWLSNIFGEMAKILIERERPREKQQEYFAVLLQEACYSVSDLWKTDSNRSSHDDSGELSKLLVRLDAVCLNDALGYYFQAKTSRFRPTQRPDTVLKEQVRNHTLARHFDRRLRELLQSDLPRLKEYARVNMPVLYRLTLPPLWADKRPEWVRLLRQAGFEDLIKFMQDMGDLTSGDDVGLIDEHRREEVIRAGGDLTLVTDLLKASAKELKSYLYTEARRRINYRAPVWPTAPSKQKWMFDKISGWSRTNDPDAHQRALALAKQLWLQDTDNLDVRDWVAYLQARLGNLVPAEQMFRDVLKRSPGRIATSWNLAVIRYENKDEQSAYTLFTSVLDSGAADPDLLLIILGLSLALEDQARFLAVVPRTLSLRYHALAICTAHSIGDRGRAESLLGQLTRHWQARWQMPDASLRLDFQDFDEIVKRAIVEGQVEQLIPWLELRISTYNTGWVPNYITLARVLEKEKDPRDIDGAFRVLRQRLDMINNKRGRVPREVDEACRDLLDLCERTGQLGKQAYDIAKEYGAAEDLLQSFRHLAPDPHNAAVPPEPGAAFQPEDQGPAEPIRRELVPLANRLVWVNAAMSQIRNVQTYLDNQNAIDELTSIITTMHPDDSVIPRTIMGDMAVVIRTFSSNDPDQHDIRRTLFDRAQGCEDRLAKLFAGGAMSKNLENVLTPYQSALKLVVGDMSRLAGVAPDVESRVENPFLSLENARSTLVLRLFNKSVRAVTDVLVEVLVEQPTFVISGKRDRLIAKIESQGSQLVTLPLERTTVDPSLREVAFGVSLRASAEGSPNVPLGISKKTVPIRTLATAIGADQIPLLFQTGQPLAPREPALFQGRTDVLKKIAASFLGGEQHEKYFLDGIRRVGKTSLLNFLPLHLPPSIIPIPVNVEDDLHLQATDSAGVLQQLAVRIARTVNAAQRVEVEPPTAEMLRSGAGPAFDTFLSDIALAAPGHVPLLIIDEFQLLLTAIRRSGVGTERDALVLDVMRGLMEKGKLRALFTGSVRFDRLSDIVNHRIFGSLIGLRVSFLSEDGVSKVLGGGLGQWVALAPEAPQRVYEYTGGYPWLVQRYGSALVDRNLST